MKCLSAEAKHAMAKIFNLVNMSDLPALADNVSELLALLSNENTTARQLTQAIHKDVALTSKVLQVVNSAYYSRGVKIGSVCKAITLIGHTTIRELATSIALFENFIKAGGDKKKVTNLLTQAYLSATLAQSICIKKKLRVSHEEAFICGLFHNLGELIVLTYLPDLHRRVEKETETAPNKHLAARKVLCDLTFYQIGMEIAVFWNLLEKIVYTMHPDPPPPRHPADDCALLMNVAAFSNQLTEQVSNGGHTKKVFKRYCPILNVEEQETFTMLDEIIETAGNASKFIRSGIRCMKLHSKLIVVAGNDNDGYERIN